METEKNILWRPWPYKSTIPAPAPGELWLLREAQKFAQLRDMNPTYYMIVSCYQCSGLDLRLRKYYPAYFINVLYMHSKKGPQTSEALYAVKLWNELCVKVEL